MSELTASPEARPPRWMLPALLLAALAVRGSVLIAMPAGLDVDTDEYRDFAETYLRTGVYTRSSSGWVVHPTPSANRPPLYPRLLIRIAHGVDVPPLRIGLLHLILGVGTVWLTWIVGRMWGLGRLSAIAALLVACDPILLGQSVQIMTETLATFLAVLALFCLTRLSERRTYWEAGLAGGALALAALCRPTFYAWVVLALIVVVLLRGGWVRRAANVLAFLFIGAVVVAPWAVRNYRALGRPIITTTHGGYTLLLANNPGFYDHLRTAPWGATWSNDKLTGQALLDLAMKVLLSGQKAGFPANTELLHDRVAYDYAIDTITESPGMFAWASAVRVGRLWRLAPHAVGPGPESTGRRLLRWSVGAWYAVVFTLAATGLWALGWRAWRTPWLWAILLCAAFTAVHAVYWSNMRMRAPVMPVVCLAAAVGVAALIFGLKGRNKTAQGNALGGVATPPPKALKGRNMAFGRSLFRPFRAFAADCWPSSQGVALGYFVGPLRGGRLARGWQWLLVSQWAAACTVSSTALADKQPVAPVRFPRPTSRPCHITCPHERGHGTR